MNHSWNAASVSFIAQHAGALLYAACKSREPVSAELATLVALHVRECGEGRLQRIIDSLSESGLQELLREIAARSLGAVRSERKSMCARENGKRGGRPRMPDMVLKRPRRAR